MSKQRVLLWLDDKRNPFIYQPKVPTGDFKIVWVRNYTEFIKYIEYNSMPYLISFDHDLHEEHYVPKELWDDYEASKKYQEKIKQNHEVSISGEGVAEWLVSFCKRRNVELPICYVHSANPVGADWIRKALKQ